VTELGRAISSANGIRDGVTAKWVVTPDEDVEKCRQYIRSMLATAGAQSFVEGQLAAHAGECLHRLERVGRVRERVLAQALDQLVAESGPGRALQRARDAREALRVLGALADDVIAPVQRANVAGVLPAMRSVANMVAKVELGVAVTDQFTAAVERVAAEEGTDIPVQAFVELATAARHALGAVESALPVLERGIEKERERLVELTALGDDKESRRLDRLRGRVVRELNGYLKALRDIQELAAVGRKVDSGSLVPFVLELKVLGRANAQR
jgi:hypothetical protein